MEEEPPQPSPTDLPDAVAPQPTTADSAEEERKSVPQCEEVDGWQSIQPMGESVTEETGRRTEESAFPNPQCLQPDDGGERRSTVDEEEGEEYLSAVEEEEKPQVDGSDERVSPLREEELVEEQEKVSSLKEEEEEERVLTSEHVAVVGAAVDEVMQENVEEKISDAAGPSLTEKLDGEMPQLDQGNEKVYSLKEEEEEAAPAPISEPAVDEVMHENLEEKPHQTEELNGERPQLAEGDGQGYSSQEALVEKVEKASLLEDGLGRKEGEEKILVSDDIMQENVEEKLPDFDGMQPAEQLDEKMTQPIENDGKVYSFQEEFVGEEKKVPLSRLSGFIADVDDVMRENVEGKLSEEQLNEEKPRSVKKGKKVSSSRRELEEEDEKVSSSQEEYAVKDEKVSAVQEVSDDKEESDEKEEAEEMDMDEGPPAMAAGRRTGTKRKRGRPQVAQGRKARAPPKPKEEEEELCFICFDGGDLVVCDHRGCPKVYHPSCVNRDEAYFKAKGQWSCGWHICSNCQKSARYMCYTCTYSLCKRCIKEAEFVCVRGNRGFCETCMKTVMQIEMNKHADETTDVVDFDDKTSWMYLFKDYWVDLKAKLSLRIEELTGARNPLKETNATFGNEEPLDKKRITQLNKEPSENPGNASDDQGGCSSSSIRCYKERASLRKKVKKRPRNMANKEHSVKGGGAKRTDISEDIEWASNELLEFVAHMKDGDRSVLSQFDVQALLLEYIKQNNLRDPRRKSQVICDSRLRALFGKSRVGHLEMLKLLEPHFFIKEASPLAADDNQGGVVDPDLTQTEAEGNSGASTKMGLDVRRKPRRRVEEKGLINLDDYAAIDVHNVNLMYLRRNLLEDFLDDIDMFNENVVGSFVRIRISGSASNKDMYRLVQVVGTGKAAEKYKTGKKATDITLEVLNLNKREFLTIDLISNQDFTEEECKRLRQSVKCGFIDRLTAAEVQEKAKVLHTVKVNDWLETEKLRLGHLRDRASEKGRKKEHRECVEKLQLLSTPEERITRLNEVPEIHVDPNMDPDYDSTEDEDDLNAKRQDNNKMPKSSFKDRDEFSAIREGSATWKNSDAVWNSNRSTSKPGVQDVVLPTVPAARNQENDGHQVTSPETPKAEANATGVLKNAHPVVEPGQSSGVRLETAPHPANAMSSNISETEKMWHYQDPAGKIQGPFSMTQLRKWNASKFFPTKLRIWRTSEKQEDSIFLTDALSGKFHKDLQQQEPQHRNSTQPTNVAAVVDSRVNNLGGGMRGNNNQTAASFPATGNYNLAKSDRCATQPSSLSPNNAGIVSPMDRRPTTASTGWESSKDSNAWSGQSQLYNSPRTVTPLSRNSSQQPSFQGRDGRGDNNGRWNGGRGHQNNWNSNKHRRFQNNGRGYERQHPYQSSSSQQFPGEQWKMQHANDSSNQLGSSSFNIPAHGPQPSNIDWASLQGALNRILPPSIQPMSSGPSTIPRGSEGQQSPSNLTSPSMNSIGRWASSSVPNVNPAKTRETVGVMNNFQQQNKSSESPALVTSGNHAAVCTGNNTAEFVDDSDRKQRLETDNSNTTPNSKQASSDVLNSGSIQPAISQLSEAGDRGIPSNELDSNKKCPEAHERSASENKIPVDGTGKESGPASVAPNALGSSNLPDASVSVHRLEASSAKAQFESQCWPPASAQQQGPNNSSVNPNPAQPLNRGWGMAPQHPNPGTRTVQEIGNLVYPAIPGAANMGRGMMAHGLVNMTWGTPANLNWVPPAQSPMSANLGWAIPQQGNANVNLAWGAQTPANPNAGWVMSMQVNSAQNYGWVAPNVGNANPNSGWVAPTEATANQNATRGTLMQGTGQGSMSIAANQNGDGGKTNSCGDGGSSHALPPAEHRVVCKFHENGHCKKGASCSYIHP